MDNFADLLDEDIDKGLRGFNQGIPFLLEALDEHLYGIQKGRVDLIGGATGTGKTAYVDYFYVVMPILAYLMGKTKFKPNILYWSMEIAKRRKIAKIATVLIFLKHRKLLSYTELLSIGGQKPSSEVLEYVKDIRPLLEDFSKFLYIIEGAINPTGIYVSCKNYLEKNGKVEDIEVTVHGVKSKTHSFTHKDKDVIYYGILDHIGLLRKEEGLTKKETIDRMSNYEIDLRNNYGFSYVNVSQLNRSLSDIQRQRFTELTPTLEDIKESGGPGEDANVVKILFSPERYNISPYKGYPINKLRELTRFLFIVKNRDGREGMIALRFLGQCGYFDKLPKSNLFDDYEEETIREIKDTSNILKLLS